jgi:hypothetical protein
MDTDSKELLTPAHAQDQVGADKRGPAHSIDSFCIIGALDHRARRLL